METDGSEDLGKHLDKLINEAETEEDPQDEEISFGRGQSFFRTPSFAWAFIAQDLCTPNLLHIFWASIRIPVPAVPSNATNAMFDMLDDFLTKMKEVDCHFMVFPHNLSQYGTPDNLPHVIDKPEDLPTEVDDWLVYFPQAKLRHNRGDIYMMVLLGCSIPLGKIMKENNNWFRETRFSLQEATIQMEAPVLVGWLLFSTNTTNTDILKREISHFIEDIPVGLKWKMISLAMQGKIPKENQVQVLHVYVNKMDMVVAKPQLMDLYEGNARIRHVFPLHICMWLVPEIDSVLNMQEWKNQQTLSMPGHMDYNKTCDI